MPLERDQRIGPTAHYTAYVWYRLGLPHADLFKTSRGARLFWTLRLAVEWLTVLSSRVPTMVEYLAARHLWIERELARLTPDCVVEIGAGLSRRGVTWAADRAVRYIEVDLPHMTEKKREMIEAAPLPLRNRLEKRLSLVSFDVLDAGFSDWLSSVLDGASRPVVIAEGLLGYFALPERARIAASVARGLAACGGGSLLCDMRTKEHARNIASAVAMLRAAIQVATRGRGTREDFGTLGDVRAFFSDAGFTSAQPLDRHLLPPALAQIATPVRVWHARVDGQLNARSGGTARSV